MFENAFGEFYVFMGISLVIMFIMMLLICIKNIQIHKSKIWIVMYIIPAIMFALSYLLIVGTMISKPKNINDERLYIVESENTMYDIVPLNNLDEYQYIDNSQYLCAEINDDNVLYYVYAYTDQYGDVYKKEVYVDELIINYTQHDEISTSINTYDTYCWEFLFFKDFDTDFSCEVQIPIYSIYYGNLPR